MFKIISICRGGGYKYCRTIPLHPKRNSNGLYPLHRVLIENNLGRLLSPDEIVHHKDGNKNNDSVENLEILTPTKHAYEHVRKIEPVNITCPICKKCFMLKPGEFRLRSKRNKSKNVYCSRECGGKQGTH